MRSSLVVSDGNPEPLDLCCTVAHNAEAKTSAVVHMGIHVAAAQSLDLLTRTFLEKSGKSIRVRLPPNGVCMKEHLCLPPNGACMKEHSALQMRTRIHAHTCTFRMTFGKPGQQLPQLTRRKFEISLQGRLLLPEAVHHEPQQQQALEAG